MYHKAIKRICGRNSYDSNHECLENARLPILSIFLLENLFVTHTDFSRQKAHVL